MQYAVFPNEEMASIIGYLGNWKNFLYGTHHKMIGWIVFFLVLFKTQFQTRKNQKCAKNVQYPIEPLDSSASQKDKDKPKYHSPENTPN